KTDADRVGEGLDVLDLAGGREPVVLELRIEGEILQLQLAHRGRRLAARVVGHEGVVAGGAGLGGVRGGGARGGARGGGVRGGGGALGVVAGGGRGDAAVGIAVARARVGVGGAGLTARVFAEVALARQARARADCAD